MLFRNAIKLMLLFIGVFFFNSHASFAANPPKWVFRVDARSPEEIFNHGFSPWGTNRSLYEHVTGTSCTMTIEPNSSFISTSSSNQWIINDALRQFFRFSPESHFYVYQIRADENFYEMNATLQNYGEAIDARYRYLWRRYASSQEWFTDRPILPEMIRGVQEYQLSDLHNHTVPRLTLNPNYVDRDTRGNPRIYPRAGQSAPPTVTRTMAVEEVHSSSSSSDDEAAVGARMSPTLSCDQQPKKISIINGCSAPSSIKVKTKILPFPREPFSESVACKITSILFYSYLECKSNHTHFYVHSGGLGFMFAPIRGKIHFNDSFNKFITKSCHIGNSPIGPYNNLTMRCGNGLEAYIDGRSPIRSWIAFGHKGYFYRAR